MHAIRRQSLIICVTALMAVTVVAFLAHIGADDHAQDCHLCQLTAGQVAVAPGTLESTADTGEIKLVVGADVSALVSRQDPSAPPRAPPHS